jgi:hypothetical protein
MGDGKRCNTQIFEIKDIAAGKFINFTNPTQLRECATGFVMQVDRKIISAGQGADPLTVIGVLMGHQQGIEIFTTHPDTFQAPSQLTGRQTSIDQDTAFS